MEKGKGLEVNMLFEETGIYEYLNYYGIETEEKATYLICKKKLETFYITRMERLRIIHILLRYITKMVHFLEQEIRYTD